MKLPKQAQPVVRNARTDSSKQTMTLYPYKKGIRPSYYNDDLRIEIKIGISMTF